MKPFVEDKKVRIVATLDAQRFSLYPDTPCSPELGVPELTNFRAGFFFGFFAPGGTSPAMVEQLGTAINRALSEPAVQQRVAPMGFPPAVLAGTRPADFTKYLEAELERIATVVREAKLNLS